MATDPIDYARIAAVKPPGARYVDDDAYLRASLLGNGAGLCVITGSFLTLEGRVVPFRLEVAGPSSRTVAATAFGKLGCGWILSARAIMSAATSGLGQYYLVLDIVRGAAGNGGVGDTLIADVLTSVVPRGWPNSGPVSPLERAGVIRSITGTDPAAGTEISETVPAGARWKLLALKLSFVTSATVANRIPVLAIDDGANQLLYSSDPTNQPASQTVAHAWAAFGASANVNGTIQNALPSPPLVLLPGYRIRTLTTALDAGDNYGAPQYQVEEWLEGA